MNLCIIHLDSYLLTVCPFCLYLNRWIWIYILFILYLFFILLIWNLWDWFRLLQKLLLVHWDVSVLFYCIYAPRFILYSIMLTDIWVISLFPYYKQYCLEHCYTCFWYTSYFLVHIFVYMNLAVVKGISNATVPAVFPGLPSPFPTAVYQSSSALHHFQHLVSDCWISVSLICVQHTFCLVKSVMSI